jgi:hypothetical protein
MDATLERRLLRAGFLVGAGLIIEIAVSTWLHPLAFVAFLALSCPLVLAGMLLFLFALAGDR